MLLFVSSESVESKLVKLETSRTVILPPMVFSGFCVCSKWPKYLVITRVVVLDIFL